jgi:hypothetical protein
MFVYLIMSYNDWQTFKKDPLNWHETYKNDTPKMTSWMAKQFIKRCPNVFSANPIYCLLEKPPLSCYPAKRAVLKIKVPDEDVLLIDEHPYIFVLNNIENNSHEFLSYTQKEHNRTWSENECLQSYERIFNLNHKPRQTGWIGQIEPRVFIPYVTRSMIKKVWIYRKDKRLRKKTFVHARK